MVLRAGQAPASGKRRQSKGHTRRQKLAPYSDNSWPHLVPLFTPKTERGNCYVVNTQHAGSAAVCSSAVAWVTFRMCFFLNSPLSPNVHTDASRGYIYCTSGYVPKCLCSFKPRSRHAPIYVNQFNMLVSCQNKHQGLTRSDLETFPTWHKSESNGRWEKAAAAQG